MTCIPFRMAITITLLLASQAAHGRSEYRLGGEDGKYGLEAYVKSKTMYVHYA